jgi:hypothetical protein
MSTLEHLDAWEEMAAAGRLADAVVEYVRANDWVSFPELQQRLGAYLETGGDVCLELRTNLVVWAGMSQAFADLVQGLLAAGRLSLHPASVMTYLIDGGMLRLPLAKRDREYRKPHWSPACLRVVPLRRRGGVSP